jgi:hypothetical protein
VLCARAVSRCYNEESWGNQVSSVRKSVKKGVSWKGAAIQRRLERGSRIISIVRRRYQGKAGEDIAGWKRLSVCASDL